MIIARTDLKKRIWNFRYFYLFLIPAIIYYAIFAYAPIYGITLSFKEYAFNKGILGSPWIGFDNFRYLFSQPEFWSVVRNTVIISFGKIFFQFPCAIVLALLLNELPYLRLKRFFQTVYTFPHFLSWIVVTGISFSMLADTGMLNQIIVTLGGEKVNLLSSSSAFRYIIFASNVWKEAGWDTIIYLAVLAGINPELYEASSIDGANRFQRVWHITWPCLRGIAAILFVLAMGQVMNAGFDQVINLYSPPVYDVGDIIDTYIYRTNFVTGQSTFGVSTAIGTFKAIINFALVFGANYAVKKMGEEGLM